MVKILYTCGFFIFIISGIIYLFNGYKKDEQNNNLKKDEIIEFNAELTKEPVKSSEHGDKLIYFKPTNSKIGKNNEFLNVFSNGGVIIEKIKTGKKLVKGSRIRIKLHKNFYISSSIPPQLSKDSVVSVEY